MLVKAVGKRIIKIVIALVVLLFLLAFALGIYCKHTGISPFAFFGFENQEAAEQTAENVLGVRDQTFDSIKDTLNTIGIDSSNTDALIAIIAGGKDQLQTVKEIISQFQDNLISKQEAKEKLLEIIDNAKGE